MPNPPDPKAGEGFAASVALGVAGEVCCEPRLEKAPNPDAGFIVSDGDVDEKGEEPG